MIITCSSCGAQFNIPDAKIPDKGARVRCVKCKNVFKIEKNKKGSSTNSATEQKQKPELQKTKPQKKTSRKTQIEHETPPAPPPLPPPPIPERPKETTEKGVEEEIYEEPKKTSSITIKKGAPPWIMTFADLATLMLTFFILMLSFANTDIVKFKEMLGSVQDAFGVTKEMQGKFQSTLKGKEEEKMGEGEEKGEGGGKITDSKAKEELQRQQVVRNIEKTANDIGEAKNISVTVGEEGINVRIKGAYFFDPGSAILKRAALPFLDNIGRLMKQFPFKLKVEGHTDDIPISTLQFPSNWELSAVRATSVLRYFTEQKGIDPLRLTAIGYAENKPIASNDTPEGRADNRRVEFVFFR